VGAHRRCRGGARHLGDRRHPPAPKALTAVSHGGRALGRRRPAAQGRRSSRLRSGGLAAPIGQLRRPAEQRRREGAAPSRSRCRRLGT
jgi:hypothetical protein